jgi:hypothetical protein
MVVTDDGAFVETQPVQMVSSDSLPDIIELIEDILNTTPEKARPEDLSSPEAPDSKPVLLEMLRLQRWLDFEKRALMYTLHRAGSQLNLHATGRGGDGMWTVDNNRNRSFDVASTVTEAAREIAAEIVARRPVESPKPLGLALRPSSPDPN